MKTLGSMDDTGSTSKKNPHIDVSVLRRHVRALQQRSERVRQCHASQKRRTDRTEVYLVGGKVVLALL
jgi:hypothetical protein